MNEWMNLALREINHLVGGGVHEFSLTCMCVKEFLSIFSFFFFRFDRSVFGTMIELLLLLERSITVKLTIIILVTGTRLIMRRQKAMH